MTTLDANQIRLALEREAFRNPLPIKLANEASELAAMCAAFEQHPINSQADLDELGAAIVQVKTWLKQAEADRLEATAPVRGLLDGMRSWWKPYTDALVALEKAIKARLARHDEYQRALAAAEQAKAAEAFAAGNVAAGQAALAAVPAQTAMPAGVSMRKTWNYEIVDPSAVPAEFWSIDHGKIAAHMKASTPPAVVPGVRFFQETGVAVRTR